MELGESFSRWEGNRDGGKGERERERGWKNRGENKEIELFQMGNRPRDGRSREGWER